MVEVTTEHEFAVDAKKLWAVLANFGDISWIPGIEKVVLEGKGVGMVRHVTAPGLPTLAERLDAIDHENMSLDISVPFVEFIKAKNYRLRAQVVELEGERCRLRYAGKAEPDGVTEAECTTRTQGFYEMVMNWLGDFLKSEDK